MPTADHQQPANTNISQCNLMNSSHIYMVMALRRLKLFLNTEKEGMLPMLLHKANMVLF